MVHVVFNKCANILFSILVVTLRMVEKLTIG